MALLAVVLLLFSTHSASALSGYAQDFEGLAAADPAALANDGWLVFGNVFAPGGAPFLYNYGPFPAPNGGPAFSTVDDSGQGGPGQGAQVLSVYNDYNNGDHGIGNVIEANVFQEQIIAPGDVGTTWRFRFDAKPSDVLGPQAPSTALAFIKTLDPNAGFALTNFLTIDTAAFPSLWQEDLAIDLAIDAGLSGQILQFGFLNTATFFAPTAVFYDNVSFDVVPEPGTGLLGIAGLVAVATSAATRRSRV
jgi:hypothetical protein